jgi:hypothetical protein
VVGGRASLAQWLLIRTTADGEWLRPANWVVDWSMAYRTILQYTTTDSRERNMGVLCQAQHAGSEEEGGEGRGERGEGREGKREILHRRSTHTRSRARALDLAISEMAAGRKTAPVQTCNGPLVCSCRKALNSLPLLPDMCRLCRATPGLLASWLQGPERRSGKAHSPHQHSEHLTTVSFHIMDRSCTRSNSDFGGSVAQLSPNAINTIR